MSKRDRELKQRLEELFSVPAETESRDAAAAPAQPETSTSDTPQSPSPSVSQAALPASLEFWQTVLDQLPLPVYIKDRNHVWIAANPAFGDFIGQPAATLIGHADKEQPDEAWQLDDQVLETSQADDTQQSTALPDGSIRTQRVRRVPLNITDGHAQYVLGMLEVTVKVSATPDAVPSIPHIATDFEIAFEHAVVGMALVTTDGRFIHANSAWCAILGYTEQELLSKHFRDLTHPDDVENSQEYLRKMLAGAINSFTTEKRYIHKQGHVVWVELSSVLLRDANQQPLYFISQIQAITERKQLETRASDLEALYQSVVETLPHSLCRKDLEGRFTFGNQTFCDTVGLSLAELIGKTDYDIHPPELAEQYRQDDRRVMESGRPEEFVEAHSVKDSPIHYVRTIKTPVHDDQGRVVGIQIMFRDVTESQTAHEELKLRTSALESAANGIAITDRDGDLLWINPAFTQLTGYTLEEATGQNPRVLTSGMMPPEFYQRMWHTISTGQVWRDELVNQRKDGSEYFEEMTITPVRTHGDEITHYIAVKQDITARRRNEEQLRLLTSAVEAAATGVIMTDHDGRIQWINPAFTALTGYSTEEAIGQTPRLLKSGKQPPEFYQKMWSTIGAGEVWHGELINRRKDGTEYYEELTITPVRTQGQTITHYIAILQDITERKQAEEERERAMKQAAKRARQLHTAAEISGAAAAMLHLDELLPVVVELVRERFDLYYAGLFLKDEANQWAILRAGTGEAGRKMLESNHRLKIGGESMIGQCVASGDARIALDAGAEAVRFSNPLLPRTRSEMALPLSTRGRVIGALTIQSDQLSAFSPEDISVLQTMANQIATTIENVGLFDQARTAHAEVEARLNEIQILQQFGQAAAQTLDVEPVLDTLVQTIEGQLRLPHISVALIDRDAGVLRTLRATGNMARLQGLARSLDNVQDDITMDVARKGQAEIIDGWDDRLDRTIYDREGHANLVRAFVPLRLRDESIGVLEAGYLRNKRAALTPEEMRVLRGLTDQVAIALDNARLLEQTRQILGTLRTNEAQLNEALRIARLGYWEYDVEKDLFQFNDQFYSIFHTTAEQHGGYQLSSAYYAEHFVYSEDLPIVGTEIEKALNSTDRHYNRVIEHRIRYADGDIGYISVSINIDRDEQGKILRYYGANQDITDRKRTEDAIRTAEERLRLIVETIPIPLLISAASDGKVLFSNTQLGDMFGLPVKELLGRQTPNFYANPADRGRLLEQLRRDGALRDYELQVKKVDGTPMWMLVSMQPLVYAGQDALLAAFYNVTERKHFEEILQQNRTQLAEALRVARLANWEYDVASDTFIFNDEFYALLRTTAEREGGYQMSSAQYAQRFVHPEDAPLVGQEILKAIQSADPNFSGELDHRIFFADGEPGHITVRYRIQKDAEGRTIKTLGANQDITDRKQAEAERERALAEAERLSAENRQLYEQTQRDAERERTINRVTARIRNAQTVEQVLHIAAQELRTATQSAASVIKIAPADSQPDDHSHNGHGQNGKE